MTTALLRQIQKQDQQKLADEHNRETKQSRRLWVATAYKADLKEEEYDAAVRACDECGCLFVGHGEGATFQMYRDPVTGMLTSGKEQSALMKSDARYRLNALRQAVSLRCKPTSSANVAEWIVARCTAQDIAESLGFMRQMGSGREPIPDTRPIKRVVQHVLIGMADYYAACDLGRDSWRGRAA